MGKKNKENIKKPYHQEQENNKEDFQEQDEYSLDEGN